MVILSPYNGLVCTAIVEVPFITNSRLFLFSSVKEDHCNVL